MRFSDPAIICGSGSEQDPLKRETTALRKATTLAMHDTESHGQQAGSVSLNQQSAGISPLGVVVIGRNEGARLEACLRSVLGQLASKGPRTVVYVDSGSTDRSVIFARSLGVTVVDLDMSKPFTMARGRNAGFDALLTAFPQLEFVHFIDGDCEVEEGWFDAALAAMAQHPTVSVVTGMRRERYPRASIYNRLTDMEWRAPAGEVAECGGDALYRTAILRQVGLFNPTMIAGEEPELCVRIRLAGGKILRLASPMTIHDAAMTRFDQWWKRSKRSGHAYAEGAMLHGRSVTRHNVRQTISALTYGVALPVAAVAVGGPIGAVLGRSAGQAAVSTVLMPYLKAAYGAYKYRLQQGDSPDDARVYAVFCMLGKFPEALGVATYVVNYLRGKHTGLIEYK
jgi:GT2 family glycosyltransferase